jgi:hypothetical protein
MLAEFLKDCGNDAGLELSLLSKAAFVCKCRRQYRFSQA